MYIVYFYRHTQVVNNEVFSFVPSCRRPWHSWIEQVTKNPPLRALETFAEYSSRYILFLLAGIIEAWKLQRENVPFQPESRRSRPFVW